MSQHNKDNISKKQKKDTTLDSFLNNGNTYSKPQKQSLADSVDDPFAETKKTKTKRNKTIHNNNNNNNNNKNDKHLKNKTPINDKPWRTRSSTPQSNASSSSSSLSIHPDPDPVPAPSITTALPAKYRDAWDSDHVRLPCSPCNVHGRKKLSKWYLIQTVLHEPIADSFELENAILRINNAWEGKWDFSALHDFFLSHATRDVCWETGNAERNEFFIAILPRIQAAALSLPHRCRTPIPLLKQGHRLEIVLSQRQVLSLLANAFFCTFPRRNSRFRAGNEYHTYPSINFNDLFRGSRSGCPPRQAAKLRCLIQYFKVATLQDSRNHISFERRCLDTQTTPNWHQSEQPLCRTLHIRLHGGIEDASGMLQVDFANKTIGGGVLGQGCIQEEIRFCMNPELIVARLFTETFQDNESMVIRGAERYSNCTGYSDSFRFLGPYIDSTPIGDDKIRQCEIVAIDALECRHDPQIQFTEENMLRELNKAYCGFFSEANPPLPPIATGNWGCGAFGGNRQLKSLLQILAASEAGRSEMEYFTYEDTELSQELDQLYQLLLSMGGVTVSDMFRCLKDMPPTEYDSMSVFAFVSQYFMTGDSLEENM